MSENAPSARQAVILAADDDTTSASWSPSGSSAPATRCSGRDGEEALALALEHTPDLAVLDVMMPKMDGFEVIGACAPRRRRSACRSSCSPPARRTPTSSAGFDAGADDYLRKPFSPQELRARVQSILGRR